jgi:hypothetical protein
VRRRGGSPPGRKLFGVLTAGRQRRSASYRPGTGPLSHVDSGLDCQGGTNRWRPDKSSEEWPTGNLSTRAHLLTTMAPRDRWARPFDPRRKTAVVVAGLLVVAISGFIGVMIGHNETRFPVVDGTIASVSANQICVKVSDIDRCGVPRLPANQSIPHVGDYVEGIILNLPYESGLMRPSWIWLSVYVHTTN